MSRTKERDSPNIRQIFYDNLDMLLEKLKQKNKDLEEIDLKINEGGIQKEKA